MSLGSFLSQKSDNGTEHVIAYHSRKLSGAERNYSTTERELLAIVDSVHHFRSYLEGTHFTIISDHGCLKYLNTISSPSGRLARWACRLSQYSFDFVYKKGSENNLADGLSRIEVNSVTFPPTFSESTDAWYNRLFQRCKDNPQRVNNFMIDNGNLYRYSKNRRANIAGLNGSDWKRVVPRDHVKSLIEAYHNDHCHPGILRPMNFYRVPFIVKTCFNL
jgi:hypothetical protein